MHSDIEQKPIFTFSKKADALINKIYNEYKTELTMVISNGCCDMTVPYLYDNYIVSEETMKVWCDHRVALYLSKHVCFSGKCHVIDIEENVINDSFSLESNWNARFFITIKNDKSG